VSKLPFIIAIPAMRHANSYFIKDASIMQNGVPRVAARARESRRRNVENKCAVRMTFGALKRFPTLKSRKWLPKKSLEKRLRRNVGSKRAPFSRVVKLDQLRWLHHKDHSLKLIEIAPVLYIWSLFGKTAMFRSVFAQLAQLENKLSPFSLPRITIIKVKRNATIALQPP